MTEINSDIARSLMDVGAAQADTRQTIVDGKPFVVIPNNYIVHDIEKFENHPTRKTGTTATTDSESFIAYIKKHGDAAITVVYADVDSEASKCSLVAVLNDHSLLEPHWQDFRCTFSPKLAVEWTRWIGKDRAPMSQQDFATWLEDNLGDIATVEGMPTAAEMMSMALGFEANSEKRLRSKINLQSGGVRFEFVEDEEKDTRSSMQVFERFTLGLPVFEGSRNAYPLEARLKYREKGGSLTFWYELIRTDRVFKTAVTSDLDRIKDETGFMLISGRVGK